MIYCYCMLPFGEIVKCFCRLYKDNHFIFLKTILGAGKTHLPSGPVNFSFDFPLVKYFLPDWNGARLLRLHVFSLAHQAIKFLFSLVKFTFVTYFHGNLIS